MEVFPTLGERINRLIATAPRSRPWYNSRERRWEKGRLYVTKRAVMALFMECRRDRARQAMAELDAEVAAEEAAERRRHARRKSCGKKRARTTR